MELADLETILGVKFKNRDYLAQALRHRSYLNEVRNKEIGSNERLEFLGDAVLSVIVSQFLYQKFTHSAEGDLTNYRSSLVKTQTLARIAKNLKLGQFLFLSKGEEEGGGRENPSLLADSLEAVIGAIFLDQGLETVNRFVSCHLFPILTEIIEKKAFKDFKSLLQEKIQAKKKKSPAYRVLSTSGPDHKRIFTVAVFSQEKKLGVGSGYSKQEAEQEAARDALENLGYLK